MRPRVRWCTLGVVFSVAAGYGQNLCSTDAACYTPARGTGCPAVRFGWGDCPGSKQACNWCYGPGGVFAYTPRGSTYTLSSGCDKFGPDTTWGTKDPRMVQWMTDAGGSCASDGRGGYACSGVDPATFKRQACAAPGSAPAASTPRASQACSCYTPARGPGCTPVRFGWADCPGSREACDVCYGPNGPFAYTPRGSQYTLSSGCNQLGAGASWITTDRQVAQSMANAGGNCLADGRGGYNCSNVDPARYRQAAGCGSPAGQAVRFTYFYINGINTPMNNSNWRGNYLAEYATVAINLIGLDPDGSRIRQPPAPFQRVAGNVKVGSEFDQMYGWTHNPSGTDSGTGDQWYNQNCTSASPSWGVLELAKKPVCSFVDGLNRFRGGASTGSMAPGDIMECIRQSVNLPFGPEIESKTMDATVQQVIDAIVDIYQAEQSNPATKNYFVVIGHSQGNFFVERVAYYLLHNNPGGVGAKIYRERLGLVSLASPTSYEMLDAGFRSGRIVHHTRADDGINIVQTVHDTLGRFGLSSKHPWAPNDPMLWPWPSGKTDWTFGLVTSSGTTAPKELFGWDQLNCDLTNFVCRPDQGMFARRLSYDSGVTPNPELYAPLMNSHLLDNYLDVPTATQPGKRLKPNPELIPRTWLLSPRTVPVLSCIRRDLVQLKKNLINGTNNPATSACSN